MRAPYADPVPTFTQLEKMQMTPKQIALIKMVPGGKTARRVREMFDHRERVLFRKSDPLYLYENQP
jgi:hypothetical protein